MTVLQVQPVAPAPGDDAVYFMKVAVHRPDGSVERCHLALSCKDGTTSHADRVSLFESECRRRFPGGKIHFRGQFHGPLHYVAPNGTVVRFKGVFRDPLERYRATWPAPPPRDPTVCPDCGGRLEETQYGVRCDTCEYEVPA